MTSGRGFQIFALFLVSCFLTGSFSPGLCFTSCCPKSACQVPGSPHHPGRLSGGESLQSHNTKPVCGSQKFLDNHILAIQTESSHFPNYPKPFSDVCEFIASEASGSFKFISTSKERLTDLTRPMCSLFLRNLRLLF